MMTFYYCKEKRKDQAMNYLKKNKSLLIQVCILIIIGIIVLFINQPKVEKGLLEKYGLNGLSVEDMVLRLDSITNESPGFKASITGTKLIMKEKEESIEYDIPIEKFYLSFAPYINVIHPCGTHSLMSCRGELINETFEIQIIDKNDNVIYSGLNTSMNNGFIGLWLPKGIEANLVIKYQDLSIETEITTYEDDDTCLTTPLRLE